MWHICKSSCVTINMYLHTSKLDLFLSNRNYWEQSESNWIAENISSAYNRVTTLNIQGVKKVMYQRVYIGRPQRKIMPMLVKYFPTAKAIREMGNVKFETQLIPLRPVKEIINSLGSWQWCGDRNSHYSRSVALYKLLEKNLVVLS